MPKHFFYPISGCLLLVTTLFLMSGCELLAKIPTSPKMPRAFEHPLLVDKEAEEFPKAVALAEKLGYLSADLLVKKTHCSPASFLMPTVGNCYLYFIFTTTQTVSAFGAQFSKLPLAATDFSNGDGRYLFDLINIGVHVGEYKRLRFAGNDGSTVAQSKLLPQFQRYHWQLEDATGQWTAIDFYETMHLDPALDLGGASIQGNVVVLSFPIGLARLQ